MTMKVDDSIVSLVVREKEDASNEGLRLNEGGISAEGEK